MLYKKYKAGDGLATMDAAAFLAKNGLIVEPTLSMGTNVPLSANGVKLDDDLPNHAEGGVKVAIGKKGDTVVEAKGGEIILNDKQIEALRNGVGIDAIIASLPKVTETEKAAGGIDAILEKDKSLLDQYQKFNKVNTAANMGMLGFQLARNTFAKPITPLQAPQLESPTLPSEFEEQKALMEHDIASSRSATNRLRDRNIDTDVLRTGEGNLLDYKLKGNAALSTLRKEEIGKQLAVDTETSNKNMLLKAEYDKINTEMGMADNAARGELETNLLSQMGALATGYGASKYNTEATKNMINLISFLNKSGNNSEATMRLMTPFITDRIYGQKAKTEITNYKPQ